MCRKFFVLISLILLLSLADNVSADLVARWSLDDGAGAVAADISGNGHDGTIGGTANWVAGKNAGALDFDGTSTYIDMDDEVVRGTWSLTMWLRPRDIPYTSADQDFYAVMHTDAWGGGAMHLHLRQNTSLLNADFNSGPDVTSTTVLQADEWYHAVVTVTDQAPGGSQMYINGILEAEGSGGSGGDYLGPLNFGAWNNGSRYYHGLMDDIRVYDHVLSEVEVLSAMEAKPWPYAFGPSPEDGALHEDTWVNLSWTPGELAVSHDVYLGESFDDVNAGAGDTFRGNQGTAFYVAGFPGFAYPDGLVPGTTYYWRIDEVNDTEPNSPWKGDVWSFTVPPKTAYAPAPADGAKFVAPDAALSWTGGYGSKLHTVHFGDDYDTVANASGGLPQATTDYTPAGPLEPEKTYYWRVDEFDAIETHTGDVWSFVVAKEGGGVKAEYFSGMNCNSLALTRTDPEIDFNWGNPGGPDPLVGDDQFSARWTGQVEAVFAETYTFYTNSDDGVRLWVDGQQLVNNWTNHGNTEDKGTIDLVAGQVYSVVMEYYEDGGGAVAQLRWSSPRTPKQIIPAAALSYLVSANTPSPSSGTVGVKLESALTWNPGEYAASHDVYLGTDPDAVENATKASPAYKGSKQLGDESLDPGKLAFDTTYYWRVDEVNNTNPDSPWTGSVWSFNTGDFLVVDDFESYNDIDPPADGSNRIFDVWIDGFGTTTNGALVGNDLPPYAEQSIVHGGGQSMIYRYDNTGKISEATMTLVYPRDWTEEGVTKLSLWLRGSGGNDADQVFVALGNAVVYHDDPAATQITGWKEWVIDLADFAGVDLTNVNTVTIGVGTRNVPGAAGAGTMHFDDIRLVR
ncbi:MAG: PA14 domain-containing protein [Planctomycetota bacterium]|jgi:hypothetical protein